MNFSSPDSWDTARAVFLGAVLSILNPPQAHLINMVSQWSSSLIGNWHAQVHVYVPTHVAF